MGDSLVWTYRFRLLVPWIVVPVSSAKPPCKQFLLRSIDLALLKFCRAAGPTSATAL
jgi:hypothetical protein